MEYTVSRVDSKTRMSRFEMQNALHLLAMALGKLLASLHFKFHIWKMTVVMVVRINWAILYVKCLELYLVFSKCCL